MVFILMLFECWFTECMCHDGWLALVGLYLICVCGFRMCWCYERLNDRQKWWSSLQRVCMGLMFIDFCCWWCLSVGLQSVYVPWWLARFGRVVYDLCMWLSHVLAWRTAGWSSLQPVSMELMFIDLCCWWCLYWWCLSVGLQRVCVMMVGSLWSGCIWFVYVAFACAGVTNGWMIVAAACKYGIDVYW